MELSLTSAGFPAIARPLPHGRSTSPKQEPPTCETYDLSPIARVQSQDRTEARTGLTWLLTASCECMKGVAIQVARLINQQLHGYRWTCACVQDIPPSQDSRQSLATKTLHLVAGKGYALLRQWERNLPPEYSNQETETLDDIAI